ncbi:MULTISPECIES: hypothetical protein [Pseudoalteromonas]|uniref:DUF676 domain-containing protein n=1 Tax=Pseudoalteromonas luteoviolacea (strain 2ta16) TaxID=1353533 RepID=V4J5N5_PSEL2|nr:MULTISPECIES: hypothetical protein [Pseudoalteromonas]ESP90657.1 hypothetical protein PL2TA16_01761 [Pseudoalteromonas luteoviolacea 2ta16]KZN41767.1 hypothetical protein N483_13940 [Pseudoalteromonas luteoviolacea NCIMB 1944]MCG7548074.1 hypothetical protein [Pseudoalteromonas sp. Of7M-16]
MNKTKALSLIALSFLSQSAYSSTIEGYPLSTIDYNQGMVWWDREPFPRWYAPNISVSENEKYRVQNSDRLDLSYSTNDVCPEMRGTWCYDVSKIKAHIVKSKDGVFDKPVYFVKGLNTTVDGITASENEFSKYWSDYRLRDVFKPLLNEGRDIVFLDYANISDDLMVENAQLIHFIETKLKQGNYQSTMVGYSYGGVLAKQALNLFESTGFNHQFFNYISIDAPHKGANIPYTITETIGRIKGRLEDARGCSWSSSCKRARDNARRMYSSLTEGIAAKLLITGKDSNQYFRNLRSEGYPSTYNVAFSNGSYTGTRASLPLNAQMARFEVNYSVYGDTYYTLKSMDIRSKYKAGHYYISHLFDDAPGSYSVTGGLLKQFFDGNGNIRRVTNNLLASNKAPTFITTASALDLNSNDLFSPFNPNSASTPFNKVYAVNGANLSHTNFSYHKNNLIKEIRKAN